MIGVHVEAIRVRGDQVTLRSNHDAEGAMKVSLIGIDEGALGDWGGASACGGDGINLKREVSVVVKGVAVLLYLVVALGSNIKNVGGRVVGKSRRANNERSVALHGGVAVGDGGVLSVCKDWRVGQVDPDYVAVDDIRHEDQDGRGSLVDSHAPRVGDGGCAEGSYDFPVAVEDLNDSRTNFVVPSAVDSQAGDVAYKDVSARQQAQRRGETREGRGKEGASDFLRIRRVENGDGGTGALSVGGVVEVCDEDVGGREGSARKA